MLARMLKSASDGFAQKVGSPVISVGKKNVVEDGFDFGYAVDSQIRFPLMKPK